MASIATLLQKNLGKPESNKPFETAKIDQTGGLSKSTRESLSKIGKSINNKTKSDNEDSTSPFKDFFRGVSAGFKAFYTPIDLELMKDKTPGDMIRGSINNPQTASSVRAEFDSQDMRKIFATLAENSKKQLDVLEDILTALYAMPERLSPAGPNIPNIDLDVPGGGKRTPKTPKPPSGRRFPKLPGILGKAAGALAAGLVVYDALETASEIQEKTNQGAITKNEAFAEQSSNLGGLTGSGIGAAIGAGFGTALGGPLGGIAGSIAGGVIGHYVGKAGGYITGKIGQGLYENLFGHDKQHLAKMYENWTNLDPSLLYAAIEANVPPPDSNKPEDIKIWEDQVKLKAKVDNVKIPTKEELNQILQNAAPAKGPLPTPGNGISVQETAPTIIPKNAVPVSEVQGSTDLSRMVSTVSSSNADMGSNPVIVIQQPGLPASIEAKHSFVPISGNPRESQLSSFTRNVIDANYMG